METSHCGAICQIAPLLSFQPVTAINQQIPSPKTLQPLTGKVDDEIHYFQPASAWLAAMQRQQVISLFPSPRKILKSFPSLPQNPPAIVWQE
jgi:hypothetical protein